MTNERERERERRERILRKIEVTRGISKRKRNARKRDRRVNRSLMQK